MNEKLIGNRNKKNNKTSKEQDIPIAFQGTQTIHSKLR